MNTYRAKIATVGVATLIAATALAIAKDGHGDAEVPRATHPSALAWLHPSALPTGSSVLSLPGSPARLPTPVSWQSSEGDPGTRTTVLKGPSGGIGGYLNATPREGDETVANWSAFRVNHNREEGDREVRLLAAAAGLRFRGATGSCVLDSYTTASDHRYREVACIVAGRSATTVIVAAAPPRHWDTEAPTLERAITSFTT